MTQDNRNEPKIYMNKELTETNDGILNKLVDFTIDDRDRGSTSMVHLNKLMSPDKSLIRK